MEKILAIGWPLNSILRESQDGTVLVLCIRFVDLLNIGCSVWPLHPAFDNQCKLVFTLCIITVAER